MGAWRALMSRARGRTHHPFLSDSRLHTQNLLLTPIARFETLPSESRDACTREIDPLWPAIGLGFSVESRKEARQDAALLLEDAKEFLQNIKQDLGRLDLGPSEYHAFGHRVHAGVFQQEQRTPALNAGAFPGIKNIFLQGTTSSIQDECTCMFSTSDAAISAPGLHGSKDFSIRADSVKRKRKKKMNKHKHRKLRRLARKSRK